VGRAAALHAPFPLDGRQVRWCEVTEPALIVGSAQPGEMVDEAASVAAGLEVVRRRSGGAAVVVGPGRLVWADVVIPVGDPLWVDDVGVAPLWVGEWWAEAVRSFGIGPVSVSTTMVHGPLSRLVCFAGRGPGEVICGARKLVGVSQRRTRRAALFQVALLLHWDPDEAVAGLAVGPVGRARVARELAALAVGADELVGRPVGAPEVEEAVRLALPDGPSE